jgi:formylglycine-generating enzyme required for sulfatase activity
LRLPSEVEWEYACRAGSRSAYSFGDDAALLKDHARFTGNSNGRTGPVAGRATEGNAWGLFNMLGNVREWCADEWHSSYRGAPQGSSVWISGLSDNRVVRGGGFNNDAESLRCDNRERHPEYQDDQTIGFRPAASLPLLKRGK